MLKAKDIVRGCWVRHLSCCTSLIALSLPHMAMGQAAPLLPVRAMLDENSVNVATGKPQVATPGVSIGPANGSQLEFKQVWTEGNWTHPYLLSLYDSGGRADIVNGSTSDSFYKDYSTNVAGVWTALNGNGATLVAVSGGYTYTLPNGVKINFSSAVLPATAAISIYRTGIVTALATSVVLKSGETIAFSYKQAVLSGIGANLVRLQSINSSSGWQIKLTYGSNTISTGAYDEPWNQIMSARGINNAVEYCNPSADVCNLTQSWPQLGFAEATSGGSTTLSVTDPLGQTSQFRTIPSTIPGTGYVTTQLVGVRRPSSPTSDDVAYAYDANGYVSSVTRDSVPYSYAFTNSGTTLTGTVSGPNRAGGATGPIRTTTADTVKDVVTQSRDYVSTVAGDSTSYTTNYQYDSQGRLTHFIPPEGTVTLPNPPTAGYTKYTYDARSNVTEVRRVSKNGSATDPDIVITASYAATCANVMTCNQPNWTRDARGNQTDYVYDAATGFVTSVKQPADPAGVRPETRFVYTPQRAYTKNAAGALVASPTTISSLTQVSSCTSGTSCTGTTNERLTLINYGPINGSAANNLLPVIVTKRDGASGTVSQVNVAYDKIGNLASVDGPLSGTADTTVYRFDAARQKVGVVGPDPDGGGRACISHSG